ncbi:MAG: hypothetical protein HYV07_14095 [Deltaproteobacteria bacterium]|nr:hypothetical protein [Deltaproteobacteria bacterium]
MKNKNDLPINLDCKDIGTAIAWVALSVTVAIIRAMVEPKPARSRIKLG